jgi:hypothetical protein
LREIEIDPNAKVLGRGSIGKVILAKVKATG